MTCLVWDVPVSQGGLSAAYPEEGLYSLLQKARKQREDAKQRKEENQRKSMVTQAVTNPKTLKKMMASKKERKKLMKADTLKSVG